MNVGLGRLVSASSLLLLVACSGSTAGGTANTAPAPAPAATAVAAKPFEYAATTGQYRFTAETKETFGMMGQTRDQQSSNARLITMSLARTSPETVTVTMTIDSISAVAPMGMPALEIDKVRGAKFVAKVAPNGVFYSATGPTETENAVAAAMTNDLGRALPRIKAVLAVGATWADTVRDQVNQQGLEINREIATTYRVVGDSTLDGEAAWKIVRQMSMKGTGKGAMRGADMTLQNSSTGTGILIVSKRGVLLAGSGEENGTGMVVVTANNMEINLTSKTTTQFTKVK
jgi:hypothetical protein